MPDPLISPASARDIANEFGTPIYLYDEATLRAQARAVLAFPNAFGLTARYAMKAAPNAAILKIFAEEGLHIDASSGYEVHRAMAAGIPADHISLSSQELPRDVGELIDLGVKINCTSLAQLKAVGNARPGSAIGLRVNPGLGSGGTNRTNVGGPASSFGLWHEYLEDALMLAGNHACTIERIHTHIGSGSDPEVWKKVAVMSLDIVARCGDVHTLNLGGGHKVARMDDEVSTDLQEVGAPVREAFIEFAAESGRELHLEIEPGTCLVANAGSLLTRVQDQVTTGADGYRFLRCDTGMTEILRPSLYGAQHPIHFFPATDRPEEPGGPTVIVGHCCESGDLLTPAPGDPEGLAPRELPGVHLGDLLLIGGTGAYCSAMSTGNYNSFPLAAEILVQEDSTPRLIRRRQTLDQILANEV